MGERQDGEPRPVRRPVEPPDGGAAWRALYEGPTPEAEPVEDDDADVEGGEEPRTA